MNTFIIWSLLFGLPVLCTTTGISCNILIDGLKVGRCEEVSGPAINCSDPVLKQVTLIKQLLHKTLASFGDDLTYNDYKPSLLAHAQFITALNNFYLFVKETLIQQSNISSETCISKDIFQKWMNGIVYESWPNDYVQWIDYYFPVLGGLMFTFGMLGNMMIIVIYLKHQNMRTGSNKLILNLAVGDIFLLINNILIYYSRHRWMTKRTAITVCQIIPYLRTVAIAVSVYSMVLLSVFRFLIIASTPGSRIQHFMQKQITIPVVLLLVWILAAITGIPEPFYKSYFCEFGKGKLTIYTRFVCLCLLPLAVISSFSFATSRILHRCAPGEQTPGIQHQRHARDRSAKVILSLVVVFCLTHLPLNIYFVVFIVDVYQKQMHYVFIIQLLVALNSCLNPVALFIGSSKLRTHLKSFFPEAFCNKSQIVLAGQQTTEIELRET